MSKQMERGTENAGFLEGRGYTASFLYEFFALLVGNGVYANELTPTATNEDMSITHGSGHAWINGVCYKNAVPFVLDIATADGVLNRYDSLMVRLDLSLNETYAIIVQGDYAVNPTPPEVTRNAETFDLKICDIYIPAGCTKITQDQITDTRLDASVCGVPVFPVEHLDMTTFYQQIAADLSIFKQNEQGSFEAWTEARKTEILNLLQQLNDLVETDTVGELIVQINEKVSKTVLVTLSTSGWTGDTAPYVQSVEVDGLTDEKFAKAYPAWPETLEDKLALSEETVKVRAATRSGNTMTFECWEDKPTLDIPVIVEVYV